MSGNEPGADTHLVDAGLDHDAVRDDDPVATHDLHVTAAHAHRDRALDAAFVAVELAGEQRFEADLVVFHLEQFELEPLAFGKAALGRHQQEAGIGLGRDDPVFPRFQRLRRRGARGGCNHRACRHQPRQNGRFHLLASLLIVGPPKSIYRNSCQRSCRCDHAAAPSAHDRPR
jgi:hypothetical protein